MCLPPARPDWLTPVSGPQERVQRHIVEQVADSVPGLPSLVAPVPLMGGAGSGEVGDVLGRWEPLPPHARVRVCPEQAARVLRSVVEVHSWYAGLVRRRIALTSDEVYSMFALWIGAATSPRRKIKLVAPW